MLSLLKLKVSNNQSWQVWRGGRRERAVCGSNFLSMTLYLLLMRRVKQYNSKAQQREQKKTQGNDPLVQDWLSRQKLTAKQDGGKGNQNHPTKLKQLECDRKFRRGNNSNGVAKRIPNHTVVLKLAYDVPMSGHLGCEKTLARVKTRFWWPGVAKDVGEYCCSCKVCQRMARKGPKAPMIPMPIIEVPFRRIAMDVIGPLPKSSTGKQYVVVITDYATTCIYSSRYPEAYANGSVTALPVAVQFSTYVQYIWCTERDFNRPRIKPYMYVRVVAQSL